MITKFLAAFMRLARASNSSEFALTKQMQYMTDQDAIADDVNDLRVWATEVSNLARLAFAAGSLDTQSLLIIESLAIEFRTELDVIVAFIAECADIDFDIEDEEPFDEGFFVEMDVDLDEECAEQLSDEFWSIVDANFDLENGETCECAQCVGAAEVVSNGLDDLADQLAKTVYDLTHEAYLALNEKFHHPSLRDDTTVAAFASGWESTFRAAAAEGSYELADALVRLTELTDDTIFALIAKNASNVDVFATRTTACFESARRMLALV